MTKYTHNEGSGSLFLNDKEGIEARPDWRGEIMIGGKILRIAGWKKQPKDKARPEFISLKVDDRAAPDVSSQVDGKPRTKGDEYREQQKHKPSAPPIDDFPDDSIPFS